MGFPRFFFVPAPLMRLRAHHTSQFHKYCAESVDQGHPMQFILVIVVGSESRAGETNFSN